MSTMLQKKRKSHGLSQKALADILGVSRPTLVKIEKGERMMTSDEKQKLDDVFESFKYDQKNAMARITIPQEREDKFRQIFLYILEKVGAKPNVGLTVLYKLLYFIDFDYYEKYEEQLMGLTYFKNTHGPTPRSFTKIIKKMEAEGEVVTVQTKYFSHDQKKFLPRVEPNLALLTGQELEVIDNVLQRYADKSATHLSELSHRDMPWKATEKQEDIDYELVFYRSEEFSVRDYEPL